MKIKYQNNGFCVGSLCITQPIITFCSCNVSGFPLFIHDYKKVKMIKKGPLQVFYCEQGFHVPGYTTIIDKYQ